MSTPTPRRSSWRKRLRSERELWFWTVLFIVWWGVFFLMPIYGISYAFFDYKPGRVLTMNDFVGLKHFVSFFQSRDAMKIIRNTLVLSGLRMTTARPPAALSRCIWAKPGWSSPTTAVRGIIPVRLTWASAATCAARLRCMPWIRCSARCVWAAGPRSQRACWSYFLRMVCNGDSIWFCPRRGCTFCATGAAWNASSWTRHAESFARC